MSDADCKSIADVPFLTLRTASSAIPLYQTDEALKYNDSIIDLQKLGQTPVNYPCTSILDCLSAQEIFATRVNEFWTAFRLQIFLLTLLNFI